MGVRSPRLIIAIRLCTAAGVFGAIVQGAVMAMGEFSPILTALSLGCFAGIGAEALLGLRTAARTSLTDPTTELGNGLRLREDLDRMLKTTMPAQRAELVLFDFVSFKKYNDTYGHACGDALLWRLGRKLAIAVRPHGEVYRMHGDQFAILVTDIGDAERVVADAAAALTETGEGFMIRCTHGAVSLPAETDRVSEALKIADQRLQSRRNHHEIDGDTEPGHILAPRIAPARYDAAALAVVVARELDLSEADVEMVETATHLRDVGNMAIPDAILHGSGALTEEGLRFIRNHTQVGERLLQSSFGMDDVAALVRSSHERWDGGGYPDALAGEQIPLGSRIVFVVSAFQDMTSARSHRPALPTEVALEELGRGSGQQFDPAVVAAFRRAFATAEDTLPRTPASVPSAA